MFQHENKTNGCIWSYVNLLQYRCCKRPACSGHLLWPSSGTYCVKGILQIWEPVYKYEILIWSCQVRASSYNSNKLTNQIQQFYKSITWRFVLLNMFRAPPRPSSGAYNCINSLWFNRWSVVVALLVVVRPVIWPDHNQQHCYHHAPTVKPEAVNAVVSSWWWVWRHPEHVERHILQVINL
jgi:hypothetical protein